MLRLLARLLLVATTAAIPCACAPFLAETRSEGSPADPGVDALALIPISLVATLLGGPGRQDCTDVMVGNVRIHLAAGYASEVAAACRRKRLAAGEEADDPRYKLLTRIVTVERVTGDLFKVTVETVARSRETSAIVWRREDDMIVGSLMETDRAPEERSLARKAP